jgi:LysR family transcriptional regulator, glycine cleavage system transcriptional activator
MSMLPPFAALRAFDLVGQTGGIRKAAEALGVSHAIVSRHLAGLEAMLGVALLDRRAGTLTEAGRAYHARIHAAIAEMVAATDSIRPRAGLTIWCAQGFALHWLTRHLSDFADRRTARPRSGERPVIDLRASDNEPSFANNDADGDIRYRFDWDRTPPPRDVRSEEIARPEVFAVAAPALLARHGPVTALTDLVRLPLIEEGSEAEWRHWLTLQGVELERPPVARYGQAHLTLAAARAGQGVALSNRYLCAEDLVSGRLVRVQPVDAPPGGVTLGAYVFRCGRARWSDPLLTRFRTWLRITVAQDDPAG